MIAAVAVSPEEGTRIVDSGPPERDDSRKAARKQAHLSRMAMEVAGVLRQVLHGPKGEVRGLLLEDGRVGRFPSHAAEDLVSLLVPGTRLLLRGDGSRPPTAPSSRSERSAGHPMTCGVSTQRPPRTSTISCASTIGSTASLMRRTRPEQN